MSVDEQIVVVERLSRDLRAAAVTLEASEARYLVDLYYAIQEQRKRAMNQTRASVEDDEPNALVRFVLDQFWTVENDIKRAMATYSDGHEVGRWSKTIVGIGPIIAAGLLAHVDVKIATNPSKLWRFAGLDPTVRWQKGEKRPWNARLKVLCWKIGDSFVKFHNHPDCLYGHLYAERKALEVERNMAGAFAELAAATLVDKKIRQPETRAKYDAGQLPDGRIDLRARRYAVKIFLVHWWKVATEIETGRPAPRAWVLEHGGHTNEIPVPNWSGLS